MKNLINNVNRKLGRKSRKGFSLVELLVVIAVIGVIAAIAIPAMSGIFENSRESKARRNAQNIASTYAAATAAGATLTGADEKTVAKLLTGTGTAAVKGKGSFKDSTFTVNLADEEIDEAVEYLVWDANTGLIYKGTDGDVAKD